jgi:hypothetical protein
MIEARPWLPDSCLTSRRATAAFAEAVAGWSAHWFVKPPLKAADQWARCEEKPAVGAAGLGPVKPVMPGLALQHRHEADLTVAAALLTLPASRTPLHAQDQQLLRTAGEAILADLADRLSRLGKRSNISNRASVGADDQGLFELRLNDDAGLAVVCLLASSELLVEIVRGGVQPQRSRPGLTARTEAIAANQVEYATRVGLARLPYSDLLDLAVGDVLVLDASREASFDLTVDGQVACPRAVTPATASTVYS